MAGVIAVSDPAEERLVRQARGELAEFRVPEEREFVQANRPEQRAMTSKHTGRTQGRCIPKAAGYHPGGGNLSVKTYTDKNALAVKPSTILPRTAS